MPKHVGHPFKNHCVTGSDSISSSSSPPHKRPPNEPRDEAGTRSFFGICMPKSDDVRRKGRFHTSVIFFTLTGDGETTCCKCQEEEGKSLDWEICFSFLSLFCYFLLVFYRKEGVI